MMALSLQKTKCHFLIYLTPLPKFSFCPTIITRKNSVSDMLRGMLRRKTIPTPASTIRQAMLFDNKSKDESLSRCGGQAFLSCPKIFMNGAGFRVQRRYGAEHFDLAFTVGKNFPAGQQQVLVVGQNT